MSPVSNHVLTSEDIAARILAYGFNSLGDVLRAALPHWKRHDHEHGGAVTCGIIVRRLDKKITVGHATGDHLVVIVRRNVATTILNADNVSTSALRVDVVY